MIFGSHKWAVKITHEPSGIEVVRDSRCFRHYYQARQAALRYLRSRLATLGHDPRDLIIETIDINEDSVNA